ncbi:MAG: DUF4416 family protein [bacterium]
MGNAKFPPPVNLITGVIYADIEVELAVKKHLVNIFGEIELEADLPPFNHTKYYEEEIGGNLNRKFYSFRKLIQPDEIVEIKLRTNEIEKEYAITDGEVIKRRINLDPGYVDASKLVLATTKNYTHRVYLRDGIYAEVTLKFHKKSFRPWDWTYPDYRTDDYIAFFNEVRRVYREKLLL